MNRLTCWNGKKWILPQGRWREIAERLAAYENTGLEPEQIEALKAGGDDKPIPPLGDSFTAVVIIHDKAGNAPYVDPTSGCAYLLAAEVAANADNPEVLQERGADHLVIAVYRDHWHVVQVRGYTPDNGFYTKLY